LKTVTTTAAKIFSSKEPITFVLSMPQSNTDYVMAGQEQKSFASGENMIPMFPGEKHQYDKFKGELWAQANSGTQSYVIRILQEGTILVIANAPGPQMILNTVTGQTEVQRSANVTKTVNLNNAADGTAVWTPATGKKFRVMGWSLYTNAGSGHLDDGIGGTQVIQEIPGQLMNVSFSNGYLSAAANNVLVTKSCTGTLVGTIWGSEE
jgi:hypothetical protein